MFELILNVLLWLFLAYTLNFHVLEAAVPARVLRNPYALNPGIWPSTLIVLLLICVGFNIYNIIKKNKGNPNFKISTVLASIPGFLKSKLFLGMAIVVVASIIMERVGFMVTSFYLLFAYGLLLGERRIGRLFVISALITLFLYLFFSVFLSVNLPRGTVMAIRNMTLMLESILP